MENHKGLKMVLIGIIVILIIVLIVNLLNKQYDGIEYGEKVHLDNGIEFSIVSNKVVK